MKLFLSSMFFFLCITSSFMAIGEPLLNDEACDPAPDLSGFDIVHGNVTIDGGYNQYDSIYVFGNVRINQYNVNRHTIFYGSIYATGDVYIGKKVTVTGFVYSEGTITLHNTGNIRIREGTCNEGEKIPPPQIELPVDELIGEVCNDIFRDAVQSHDEGTLTIWGSQARIIDSTSSFDFETLAGGTNANNCSAGICRVTGTESEKLSDFEIPRIVGKNITAEPPSWNGNVTHVTLGAANDDISNGRYEGTIFGKLKVQQGSIVFLEQVDYLNNQYQIDEIEIVNNASLYLESGVYAVRKLSSASGGYIQVANGAKVYFFVEEAFNGELNILSNPSDFHFIVNKNLTLNSDSEINASVYSDNIVLQGNTIINGRVASKDLLIIGSSTVNNQAVCPIPEETNQFVITTQPNALTCEPHSVTLQVLKNDSSIDTDFIGTVDLAVTDVNNNGIGDWSMATDNTRLDNKLANDGVATYTFNGSENGEIGLLLSVTAVSEVSISMSQGALAAVPKNINFQSSMIKISQTCNNPIAGQCINTANREFPLTLTAYKADESQACINYNPDKIAFWSEFNTKKDVDVNTIAIGRTEVDAVELPISFSAGVATIDANYPDAGRINIHLKDPDIEDITGEIITVVNPLKLVVGSAARNSRRVDRNREVAAGAWVRASIPDYTNPLVVDTFNVTVKAIIDCTVSSGVEKNCGRRRGDNVKVTAPSFTNTINLASSLIFPSAGVLGNLYYDNNNPDPGALPFEVEMINGRFKYSDLAYDEVGTLGLQALSSNYLDIIGNDITPSDIKVTKRFYPDYISYKENSFMAMPSCNADFSYLGEEAIGLKYILMAHPQGATQVTKNYDDSLGYPVAGSFEQFARDDFSNSFVILQDNTPPNYYQKSDWKSGEFSVALSLDPAVAHPATIGVDRDRTTPQGPFEGGTTRAIEYFIKLSGGDGEQVKVDSATSCNTFSPAFTDQCLLGDLDDVFHGRLQAGNGHGSELQPIRTTIEATYFDGTQFVPFDRDSCTDVIEAQVAKVDISGGVADKTTITTFPIVLSSGKNYFNFSAPNSRGKLDYFIRLKDLASASLYAPWLLDSGNAVVCPGETGSLKDCISGYVEFGLFRGNDRIIYRMQTFE
ncbi:DUF6701 domain-containing protein [Psychromonas sp. Urea-02u-13]|uniref:DUF6701 domain-containing protein n=1 Tax=Psychromonas sp. Urea-02u-13 TaxID=2058326 RepID=UPI000C334C91|nr:DUF6701 domain-containing protein [Psychromonas sp. Urea-02u-13]PKG38143.1 hypothetical protein CXF74_15120 [Psychromonas sp. Urea-02u-13]